MIQKKITLSSFLKILQKKSLNFYQKIHRCFRVFMAITLLCQSIVHSYGSGFFSGNGDWSIRVSKVSSQDSLDGIKVVLENKEGIIIKNLEIKKDDLETLSWGEKK